MMKPMRVGVTPTHQCSYLPDQYEQLIVLLDGEEKSPESYEDLLNAGFRRSGNDIYRPHCQNCHACQSLRILVDEFQLNKQQQRIVKKNQDLSWSIHDQDKPEYYALYEKYVNERHSDGSMYPANYQQYHQFLLSDWHPPYFLEFYDQKQLIAVAVTDVQPFSLSAMYTFFDPSYEKRSIGTLAILTQIELALKMQRPYLYLGYQVDACRKMNYKANFLPHERLVNKEWKKYDNTTA